jgi:hypothetical protein
MRSLLLVFATLLLAVCLFVIYSQMQGPIAARSSSEQRGAKGPTSIPAGGGSATQPVGAGEEAWVRRYNEKSAELESQFRAARYEPQPNGTVRVEKPVAEFFLGGGRFVRIEGTRGSVVMPNTQVVEGGEVRPPPAAPPRRGQLHDVVISMFDEPAAEGEAPEPTLTVSMNNTSFDNDTFLITTEPFTDASNNRIEADQVPVKVRGRDYDFDGRGLRIQWNELNQRLQLLEIAHGESLTVKNRAKFEEMQNGGISSATAAATEPSTAGARRRKGNAANKPSVAAATTAPTTKPTVPYRASFEKDLRITEGKQEIATGELMQVDFVLEKGDRSDGAADAAAGAQTGAINVGGRTASRSRPKATPTTVPTPTLAEPTTIPATQPAAELLPIIVRWTGRLRVMPLELSDEPPLAADAQIIRLSGTPLKLYRDGAKIEAAGAMFHTADGSASLRSSDEVPRVTLRSADGAVVSTPALTYAEDGGVAMLKGPGQADIPMGRGTQKQNLSATWGDECLLELPKDARGQAIIRRANLKGSVAIAHPRMDLNTDALELAFAAQSASQPGNPSGAKQPTTTSAKTPDLERLLATGSVIAKLKDPMGQTRSVQARTLEMQTLASPDGELLPRTIIADGDVLMSDPTQSLRAQRVNATLKPKPKTTTAPADPVELDADAGVEPTSWPTTQPAKEPFDMVLESLIAQGAVRLEGQRGAYATAEQLEAYERDGVSEVKLMGVGPSSAVVSDGKSTITGPVLILHPQDQRAEVPGGGTMVLVPEPKPGNRAPEPVHVAWTGHAALDGKTNLVDLHEGIAFKTVDAEGMTTTSKANHLQIVLADRPTTQPATQPTTDPATRPAMRPSEGGLAALQDMDFLANKDPRSAKLTGGVEVESTLLNAEGGILRRMYMKSEEAGYDIEARRMIVPLPGRLLYEDHRPPEARKDDDAGPANRGMTAFEWKRQLTYDDAADRAVMEGDVDINHVPDDPNDQSFRIGTQRVTAEMERKPATAPATLPTTAPATQSNALATRMRLKQVIADGGVSVRTKRFQFTATRLSYSPTTGILTAHGAPGDPITLTDDQGQVDSAIESLTWNTKTDQVSLKGGRGRVRP